MFLSHCKWWLDTGCTSTNLRLSNFLDCMGDTIAVPPAQFLCLLNNNTPTSTTVDRCRFVLDMSSNTPLQQDTHFHYTRIHPPSNSNLIPLHMLHDCYRNNTPQPRGSRIQPREACQVASLQATDAWQAREYFLYSVLHAGVPPPARKTRWRASRDTCYLSWLTWHLWCAGTAALV